MVEGKSRGSFRLPLARLHRLAVSPSRSHGSGSAWYYQERPAGHPDHSIEGMQTCFFLC